VGPRAGLDTEDTGKILCPCRGSNPDRPVVQPVVRHYTASANPAPVCLRLPQREEQPLRETELHELKTNTTNTGPKRENMYGAATRSGRNNEMQTRFKCDLCNVGLCIEPCSSHKPVRLKNWNTRNVRKTAVTDVLPQITMTL
jgi:hypothetical protein